MFRLIAMFSVLIIVQSMVAQNHTVGTIRLESGAYDGFNILNPLAYDTTYIIDNCGRVVNQWHGNYSNGMFAEVTVGGTLFKSGISTVNTSIHAGGGSGILQEFDWNNNLLWEYEISDSTHRLHHDLEILPNGNLLGIAWERKDSLDCVNAGRDTSTLASGEMWFTAIYEIQPVYPDSALIVWEWHAWDHLVQDFDSSKANFGVVANLKGKLDINKGHPFNLADWAHVNALDYNDSLDQIVMSSPFFNELWIIDHSTTTSEAATDQGGNSGMGGQILWRWGNPMSYDRGDLLDQELFFQHDCEWVKEGSRFRNLISVFSNRDTINGQLGSIVKVLDPEYDTLTKTYPQTSAGIYFPQQPTYTYELVDTLFSPRVSGAQFLANDNILICSGVNGHVLEIDSSEQEVWEYIVPIDQAGVIVPQGTYLNLPTSLFNIKRYPVNYIGFSGLNMTAGNTIETGQSNCGLLTNTKTDGQDQMNFNVYPNPVQGVLNVSSEHYGNFIITDVFGKQVRLGQIKPGTTKLDVRYLSPGIYNITLINERIRESRLISVAY